MPPPRIISGSAKGLRLKDVPGDITRPITDRVKEALFNILGSDVVDTTVLDLFGGTGSVGIEALSRGARSVTFVEINSQALEVIKDNLVRTHLNDKAIVLRDDAFRFLEKSQECFDIIFIAPPQYKGLWDKALKQLDSNPAIIQEDGLIIVQIDPIEYKLIELISLIEIEQRKYGKTLIVFYELKA